MATASTPIKKTKLPPQYNFPPFFTIQPNKETLAKQLSIWIGLIKNYCESHRHFVLDAGDKIFTNSALPRTLSPEGVTLVFGEMVRTGEGSYVTSQKKDRIFVWWKSRDSWGQCLMDYVSKHGLLNSVATVYELINDNPEFVGMPESMLTVILNGVKGQGKCELMTGAGGVVEGVKFFMRS